MCSSQIKKAVQHKPTEFRNLPHWAIRHLLLHETGQQFHSSIIPRKMLCNGI